MSDRTAAPERSPPQSIADSVVEEVNKVLVGNESVVEHLTIGLLTRGHILIEGVPGIAKTTVANLFANALGLEYQRVQMTPDTLPADITGTHVYREGTGEFQLQRGPVFSNLVLADEINRATPKTQSALLESMEEKQVSIQGQTLALPEPFMVVATQNPIEMEGVFELPEAQRDRFMFKLIIDLPDRSVESEMLKRFDDDPLMGPGTVEQAITIEDIQAAREAVADVYVADPVREYILDLVGATRSHPDVRHGASPRASIALLDGGKARAAIRGREYVLPDDIKALAEPTFIHRLVLSTDAELSDVTAPDVIADIVDSVGVPDTDEEKWKAAIDR